MNALSYIIAISDEGTSPKMVEEVDSNLMYIGYCLPDCKSVNDNKWLVKRVMTADGIQSIFTANGSHQYNQAWSARASLTYKPTEVWTD